MIDLRDLPLADLVAYLELNPPALPYDSLVSTPVSNGGQTGDVVWSVATTRAGAVLADGSTYDGTIAKYTALWKALGSVAPQNAFVVPDLRERVPVGAGPNTALLAHDSVAVANRHATRHQHTVTVSNPNTIGFNNAGSTGGSGATSGDRSLPLITTGVTVGVSASDPLDGPGYVALNPFILL